MNPKAVAANRIVRLLKYRFLCIAARFYLTLVSFTEFESVGIRAQITLQRKNPVRFYRLLTETSCRFHLDGITLPRL